MFLLCFKLYPVLPSLPIIGVFVGISMLGRFIIKDVEGQMMAFAECPI